MARVFRSSTLRLFAAAGASIAAHVLVLGVAGSVAADRAASRGVAGPERPPISVRFVESANPPSEIAPRTEPPASPVAADADPPPARSQINPETVDDSSSSENPSSENPPSTEPPATDSESAHAGAPSAHAGAPSAQAPVTPEAAATPRTPSATPAMSPGSAPPRAAPTVVRPRPTATVAPVYPPRARRRGWEGVAVVRVTVSADGSLIDVSLEESSGHALLNRAALSAVRRVSFTPGRVGPDHRTMDTVLRIVFRLTEGDDT